MGRMKEVYMQIMYANDDRIPEAVGVVNPNRHDSKYPFNGLAGVGIAFKTMLALGDRMQFDREKLMNELLDYVALGTVADVAPMVDENENIIKEGKKLSDLFKNNSKNK